MSMLGRIVMHHLNYHNDHKRSLYLMHTVMAKKIRQHLHRHFLEIVSTGCLISNPQKVEAHHW